MNNGSTISTIEHVSREKVLAVMAAAKTRVRVSAAGCHEWTGSRLPTGYGRLRVGNRTVYAHRFFYEATVGRIEHGLCIDHLCRNRSCVNLAHLEAVTPAVNIRRERVLRPRKEACIRGHLFTQKNTYITAQGCRSCRECHRLKAQAARDRRAQ